MKKKPKMRRPEKLGKAWIDDPSIVLPQQHQTNIARANIVHQFMYGPGSFTDKANAILHEMANAQEKFKLLIRAVQLQLDGETLIRIRRNRVLTKMRRKT